MTPAPPKWIANRIGKRIRARQKRMSMDSIETIGEMIGETVGATRRERGGISGTHPVRRRDPRSAS